MSGVDFFDSLVFPSHRSRPTRRFGRHASNIQQQMLCHQYVRLWLLATTMSVFVSPIKVSPLSPVFLSWTRDLHTPCCTTGGGLLSAEIKTPSDLFSFSHVRNAARLEDARLGALRTVSSSTRGMTATVSEQVGGLQPDAHGEITSDYASPNPRIGMGLPMSNIYATYFGGSLELVSLDGYGERLHGMCLACPY